MHIKRRLAAISTVTGLALALAVTPVVSANAAGNTLVVDIGQVVRPVTHVGAGGLYAVGSDTKPTTTQLFPLSVNGFTQPPPGTTHLGNGATSPCCDALSVADNITRAGGQQFIRMPDIYPTFPYQWEGWEDWENKVRTIVQKRLAATGTTNIMGYELWNEPNWNWDTQKAGPFNDAWTRTHRLVRSLDPVTPIVGPSIEHYDSGYMQSFMANAKNTNTVPDVVVWHELRDMGWNDFEAHVADYRAIERSLGISPRPISINEYNSLNQMDIPSVAVHWLSVFERHGARDAHRAYWFEAGTFNGLFTSDAKPTASYWIYNWYGSMAGNIVRTTPQSWLDGVASYDSTRKTVNVVLGGDSGSNAVRVNGLGALGANVDVTVSATPGSGRNTVVAAPTQLSKSTMAVTNGSITVPVHGMTAEGAYQVLITPAGGPTTAWQQTYEAENATVVNAQTRASGGASNGAYVGGIDNSGDMRSDSFVDFIVNVPEARNYTMTVRYANGTGVPSTQGLAVNGSAWSTISYPATPGWAQFANKDVTVGLRAGYNVIRLAKGSPFFAGGTGFAELDKVTLR